MKTTNCNHHKKGRDAYNTELSKHSNNGFNAHLIQETCNLDTDFRISGCVQRFVKKDLPL